jgi:hypothetical protein
MGRKWLILLLVLLAAAAVYYLWPSDETRIRRLVADGARLAAEEDLEALMEKVSYVYRDDFGLSYLMLKRVLDREFKRYENIEVEVRKLQVEVGDDAASASMELLVLASLGERRGYIIGDLSEPAAFELSLEKHAGRWQVGGSRLSVEPVLP